MKLLFLFAVIVCLSFYSCGKDDIKNDNQNQTTGAAPNNNNTTQQTKTPEPPKHEESIPEAHELAEKKTANTNSSNGIRVNFPAGATQVSMNGKISGFGESVTYLFEVKEGQTMTASVKPQSGKGNIRIGQIIFPSGKADGPFGIQMTYPLTESGDWKLILGEDQMAGDPWEGEYVLTVEIK